MRCDVHLNSSAPCSRCKRLKIECEVSEPFVRTHKRKYVVFAASMLRVLTSHVKPVAASFALFLVVLNGVRDRLLKNISVWLFDYNKACIHYLA